MTLEGHHLFITAAVDGFFLNRCSTEKFDPTPLETPYKSRSLVEMLKKVRCVPAYNALECVR